ALSTAARKMSCTLFDSLDMAASFRITLQCENRLGFVSRVLAKGPPISDLFGFFHELADLAEFWSPQIRHFRVCVHVAKTLLANRNSLRVMMLRTKVLCQPDCELGKVAKDSILK